MKPLFVLLAVFIISCTIYWLVNGRPEYKMPGRIALSAMLILTSIGHFRFKKGMALMLPSFVPAKELVIIVSGFTELFAAVGILLPQWRPLTGILLIIFFIPILPANIYASLKHVNLEKGTYDGVGPRYLWFRIPLQLFFIAWTYWFVVK